MLAFPQLEITQETLIGRSGFESCHLHTSIFFVQFFFLAFLVNGDSHKKRFLRLLELHRLEKLEKFCYSTLGIFCADNLHERLFKGQKCLKFDIFPQISLRIILSNLRLRTFLKVV